MTRLELIRQRVERATKGPWDIYAGPLRPQFDAQIVEVQQLSGKPVVAWPGFDGLDMPSKQKMANADFIAHSREDIPALLAVVRHIVNDRAAGRGYAEGEDSLLDDLLAPLLQSVDVEKSE